MPTINQLVRHGRTRLKAKTDSPALQHSLRLDAARRLLRRGLAAVA